MHFLLPEKKTCEYFCFSTILCGVKIRVPWVEIRSSHVFTCTLHYPIQKEEEISDINSLGGSGKQAQERKTPRQQN